MSWVTFFAGAFFGAIVMLGGIIVLVAIGGARSSDGSEDGDQE